MPSYIPATQFAPRLGVTVRPPSISEGRDAEQVPRAEISVTQVRNSAGRLSSAVSLTGQPMELEEDNRDVVADVAYQYNLLKWVELAQEAADSSEERRGIKLAASAITTWLRACDEEKPLVLQGLSLKSLPTLPDNVRALDLSKNHFIVLPPLPQLISLDISHNRFSILENIPKTITELDVSENFLETITDFPESIQYIDLSHNRLQSLPACSRHLKILMANNNQLRSFPEGMPLIENECEIHLCDNPIPLSVVTRLNQLLQGTEYVGPQIFFSVYSEVIDPSNSLEEAVARWYGEEQQAEVKEAWGAFLETEKSNYFWAFLDRLRDSVHFSRPEFKEEMGAWLKTLTLDHTLRQLVFEMAKEGAGSCEDRATLTLNTMRNVEINLNVERGVYDHQLDRLIACARTMFYMDRLEKIATEKAAQLPLVDEVEVYLAYMVKLQLSLNLPMMAKEMRFFDAAFITEQDIADALVEVKKQERNNFLNYLSTEWTPLQSVIKRVCPEKYATHLEELSSVIDETFASRQLRYLDEEGLEKDEFHQAKTAPMVLKQIAYEVNGQFLKAFLQVENPRLLKELEHN